MKDEKSAKNRSSGRVVKPSWVKYNTKDLMYYRFFDAIEEAIKFEKQLKFWKRVWKFELIQKENNEMFDLAANWFGEASG